MSDRFLPYDFLGAPASTEEEPIEETTPPIYGDLPQEWLALDEDGTPSSEGNFPASQVTS